MDLGPSIAAVEINAVYDCFFTSTVGELFRRSIQDFRSCSEAMCNDWSSDGVRFGVYESECFWEDEIWVEDCEGRSNVLDDF